MQTPGRVVLGAANAYLGMFAGMTVSASVPAAVLSMAILRALRTGNILQNNGVQTAAARVLPTSLSTWLAKRTMHRLRRVRQLKGA